MLIVRRVVMLRLTRPGTEVASIQNEIQLTQTIEVVGRYVTNMWKYRLRCNFRFASKQLNSIGWSPKKPPNPVFPSNRQHFGNLPTIYVPLQ